MLYAKLSTAITVIVGPVLDSTGAEYTSAVIGDLSISKNGGTLTALASAATLTHIANGQYTLVFRTADVDTLGRAQVFCNKSTYQMPSMELMVMPATVYDALITNVAGGANGLVLSLASNQVNVGQWLGTAVSTPTVAGVPNVNTKTWNDLTTVALPATPTNITAGTITTVTTVTGQLTAAQIATGVWQDTTAGDFTTALSVGKSVMNGVTLGTGLTVAAVSGAVGSVTGAVGSVTGNVGGNVVGSVASVVGAVGSVTGLTASNLDATVSSRLASASYTAPSNLTAAQIATGVWQDTTAGDFTTALSVGKSVMNGVTLGTGLTVAAVSGAVGSVTGAVGSVTGAVGSVTGNVGGNVVGSVASVVGAVGSVTGLTASNLDTTVSSRLASASYTAPSNLTAAQIATGIWQDTTAGDFTTALSVGKSVMNGVTLGTGLTIARCTLVDTVTTYTGNTVQTGDSFARIGVAGAGLTNIDLPNQTMDITGNLSGSVGSVTGAVGSVTGLTTATIATGIWQDTTAADFTVALSVGKSVMNGVTLGTGLTVARCTLADTVTTYTGNTVQTGDSFARIGATGAGLTTLATQVSVNTIDDLLDNEIAAIKAKTDQFVFTVANQVDANALSGGGGLDASGIRSAVGLASANIDTQLSTITGLI